MQALLKKLTPLAEQFWLLRKFTSTLFWLAQLPQSLQAINKSRPVISVIGRPGQFAALPFTETIRMAAPTYRSELNEWISQALPGVFLDIGAGSGALTYRALTDGHATRALAFAANPALYALLVKNIADNNLDATTVNAAAGTASGTFNLRPHAIKSGHTSSCSGKSSVRVQSLAVDDYLSQANIFPEDISLIHLGTGSQVLNALIGLKNTLSNTKAGTRVMVDLFTADAAAEDARRLLKKHGFKEADTRGHYTLFVK